MSDDKKGTDPGAVRHLRPTNMPNPGPVVVMPEQDEDVRIDMRLANDTEEMVYIYTQLEKLREPFPDDRIEKLPKPMWKDAWRDKQASRCNVCHGYHVPENTIHLDYVGHAQVTARLLEADPLWTWEPLALTEQGTPMFSDGGLWIKLTVCGVTRIGYGDGKSVKEVIGDAIRNAAMRFGVALDLWSKIDLHTERNPGDGETSDRKVRRSYMAPAQGVGDNKGPSSDTPRASNQDALDSLQSVCDEYGYSTQYCIDRFYSDHDQHIREAGSEDITAFAAKLIEEATPEPVDPGGIPTADTADGNGDQRPDAPYGGAAAPDDDAPLF